MNKLGYTSLCLIGFMLNNNVLAFNEVHKAIIQAKFLAGGVGCLREHPLSLSDIKAFRNKMLPDGDNAKCFAECLFKKIGIMDNMGKISAEGARESAQEIFKNSDEHLKKVDQFIEVCKSVNDHHLSDAGVKGCNRAKLAFTCLVEHAPKFGFDIDF